MEKISRTKIELFLNCPRCFWLDRNKGIKRPPPAPYTINSSIDYLLKQEFDEHRAAGTAHPVMKRYSVDAVPYQSEHIDTWRHNFTGVQCKHEASGFLVFGAVDDVWVNPKGELIVVDYKATGAKEHKIYGSYKRQMEMYQWLLLQNKFDVSPVGYFLFVRVNKKNGFAEAKLSFDLFLEPLRGDSGWVEEAIMQARKALDGEVPDFSPTCPYCQFIRDGGGGSS